MNHSSALDPRHRHARALTGGLAALALLLTGCANDVRLDAGSGEQAGLGDDTGLVACQLTDDRALDDHATNTETAAAMAEVSKVLQARIVTVESGRAADYSINLDSLLAQGCQLVVASGAGTRDAVQAAATSNPNVRFVIVGAGLVTAEGQPTTLPNVRSVQFSSGQGGYLAGYLAAAVSTSGIVGVIGGSDLPTTRVVLDGFVDGVNGYNLASGAQVRVLGWDKETQTGLIGTATDWTRGYAAATAQLTEGADVLMPVGGPFGQGVLKAVAEKEGALAIWPGARPADLPAYSDAVLAGVTTAVTDPVLETAKQVTEADFSVEPYLGTVDGDAVSLVLNPALADRLAAGVQSQVDAERDRLADGSLVLVSANAPAVG